MGACAAVSPAAGALAFTSACSSISAGFALLSARLCNAPVGSGSTRPRARAASGVWLAWRDVSEQCEVESSYATGKQELSAMLVLVLGSLGCLPQQRLVFGLLGGMFLSSVKLKAATAQVRHRQGRQSGTAAESQAGSTQ